MKLYKELKEARKERRKYKDKMQRIRPLYKFMQNYKHIFRDKMPQTKSKVDKIKKRQDNRTYRPRFRQDLVEEYLDENDLCEIC